MSQKSSISMSYDEAKAFLDLIGQDFIGIYPCVKKFRLNSGTEDSGLSRLLSSTSVSNPDLECSIGIKELYENVDSDGFVRDIDVVWAAKHIAHESRHLYQMRYLYQSKNPSVEVLDMARMDAIASVFLGYNADTYDYRLSEIDADYHGFVDIVEYFDNNVVDEAGKPIFDARKCLMTRVKELCYWRGNQNAETFDEMMDSLKLKMSNYRSCDRLNPMNALDLEKPGFRNMLDKYPLLSKRVNDTSKAGVERDRQLLSVVLDIASVGADVYPCLRKECKLVRKLYPSALKGMDKACAFTGKIMNRFDTSRIDMLSELGDFSDTEPDTNFVDSL